MFEASPTYRMNCSCVIYIYERTAGDRVGVESVRFRVGGYSELLSYPVRGVWVEPHYEKLTP